MSGSFGVGYLAGMFGVVAFGAVVPVVPTGAAVSVGAVLGVSDHVVLLPVVIGVGAAGAYLGDLVVYAVLRFFGERLSARIAWLHADARAAALARFQDEIARHELRTLLLSRLVPGGRIPVLLAAALGGYPFRRYVSADLAASALWAVVYAAIGVAGRSVFPEPWQGVVAAIVLIVVISVVGSLLRRRRSEVAADPRRSTS
ncbi:DedA family protein [uncultured Jatrophihabitans sp.]|uniref:DedA family protein n=1 Tax=uncultured Jatrophihabitans sp. TaxID=1610747 RepID=UPI0035C95BEB